MAAFMSTKADIPGHMFKLINQAKFVTKNRLGYIVTDNGTEFTNNTVYQCTKREHIIHKRLAPYVPQPEWFY